MNFSDNRLSTFDKSFVLNKPTKSKIKLALLKQNLVDFGFYHTTKGNTVCFACGFTHENWELSSNPLNVQHPNCYWYQNIFNSKNDSTLATRETLNLKLTSFKNGWAGIGTIDANSMSNAGFHYDPTLDKLDQVVCASCSLQLEGWEQGDNPYQEHENRRPNCPFIINHKSCIKENQECIQLVIKNFKELYGKHEFTNQERSMTVEEFIKYQQEKARQEYITESDKLYKYLSTTGDSIF